MQGVAGFSFNLLVAMKVDDEYSLNPETGKELLNIYDEILAILGKIINNPQPWLLKKH